MPSASTSEGGHRDLFSLISCVNLPSLAPLNFVQEELFSHIELDAFDAAMSLAGDPFPTNNEPMHLNSRISAMRLPHEIIWKSRNSISHESTVTLLPKESQAAVATTKMVATMPLTPATEERDQNSIVKDLHKINSKIVLKIGKRPQESQNEELSNSQKGISDSKVKKESLAESVEKILDCLMYSGVVGVNWDTSKLLALLSHPQEEPHQLSEDTLLKIIDSLDSLDIRSAIYASCICLTMAKRSDSLCLKISSTIDKFWDKIKLAIPVSSLLPPALLALVALRRLVCMVYVEETWLVSLSSWCLKFIKTFRPHEDLTLSLIETLVVAASKSQTVRNYIYEEVFISPSEQEASVTVKMANEIVSWTCCFICLDFCFKLQKFDVKQKSSKQAIASCFGSIDCLLITSDSNQAANLNIISTLAWDLSRLVLLEQWMPLVFLAKHLYSIVLKLSISKDLKSDYKIKLLECGGLLVNQLRSLELAADPNATIQDLLLKVSESRPNEIIDLPLLCSNLGKVWGGKIISSTVAASYKSLLGAFTKDPDLGPQSDRFIALLLQNLGDSGPLIRVRAIREFGRILQTNDPILGNSNFLAAVQRRMDDSSPCVREAAIEFVVNTRVDALSPDVLSNILDKISDPAVSVRKRVIKVITDLLRARTISEWTSEVTAALILEASSELKGSSEVAFSGVYECWILPVIEAQKTFREAGDVIAIRHVLANFTAEVVRVIRSPRNDLVAFKSFFKKASEDITNGKDFQIICSGVIDLLFETLVASIEESSEGAAKFILAALIVVIDNQAVGTSKHFRLICSLMLSEDCETVEYALKLIRICLKTEDSLLYRQVPDLCSNLAKLTFRGSEHIVKGSLECLFEISKTNTQVKSQLVGIYQKISSFIHNKGSFEDPDVIPLLCRGVYAISLIAKMGKDLEYEWPISLGGTSQLILKVKAGPHKTLGTFCSMAAAELLASDPIISLQEPLFEIIKDGFKSGSDSARLALLRGFHEITLRDRSTTQTSTFEKDSAPKVDYSSSLCTVFQSFVDSFQNSTNSSNPEVVESASFLLMTMLRRGLSHPQNIVPYILALWQCPWPSISQRINQICVEVIETLETYVLVTLELTVRLAYNWDLKVRSRTSQGFITNDNGEIESYFSPLYDALKVKTKRMELLTVLLCQLEKLQPEISYLIFIAESLSEVAFKSIEEVAFVIRRLSEMIAIFDDDVGSDVVRLGRQVILLRLKLHIGLCYRITTEQAENFSLSSKREHPCRRMPTSPLNFENLESLNESSVDYLQKMIEQLIVTVGNADEGLTKLSTISKRKAKYPLLRINGSKGSETKREKILSQETTCRFSPGKSPLGVEN